MLLQYERKACPDVMKHQVFACVIAASGELIPAESDAVEDRALGERIQNGA